MKVLQEIDNIKFTLNQNFNYSLLTPVGDYVNWKISNDQWDDYNELFHVSKLIESLSQNLDLWFDTHNIIKNNKIIAVLLIVGGNIKRIEGKYELEEHSLLLKYLHIIEKGKGLGSYWLQNIIIPYYKKQGFKQIYVNSSHQKSFPFYKKFGTSIASYEQMSDNNKFKRKGECFKINIIDTNLKFNK